MIKCVGVSFWTKWPIFSLQLTGFLISKVLKNFHAWIFEQKLLRGVSDILFIKFVAPTRIFSPVGKFRIHDPNKYYKKNPNSEIFRHTL